MVVTSHLRPNADTPAEIVAVLGPGVAIDDQTLHLARRYFSKGIMNTTSKLPVVVIKELKNGFKNYIPLSLCTHKACLNVT